MDSPEEAASRGCPAALAAARRRPPVGAARGCCCWPARGCGRGARGARVVVIFVVAALIALILNPLSPSSGARGSRAAWRCSPVPRILPAFAGIGFLLAKPISNQVHAFKRNVPQLVNEANRTLANLEPPSTSTASTSTSSSRARRRCRRSRTRSEERRLARLVRGGLLTETASAIFDLVLIFVMSVYMLVYGERIGRARAPGDARRRRHARGRLPDAAQRAVARYVRGQLLFSVVMGASAGVALCLFGVLGIFPDGRTYAFAFATFFGVMELVPYIGPILGAIPPVLVALFEQPDHRALGGAAVRRPAAARGPRRGAADLRPHAADQPAAGDLRAAVRDAIYGVIGALVALPILAVLRETFLYLSRHLAFEPWERSPGGSCELWRGEPLLAFVVSASATASAWRCATSASRRARGRSWR